MVIHLHGEVMPGVKAPAAGDVRGPDVAAVACGQELETLVRFLQGALVGIVGYETPHWGSDIVIERVSQDWWPRGYRRILPAGNIGSPRCGAAWE